MHLDEAQEGAVKEEVERYLELAVYLRDPNNANVSSEVITDVLDEMDSIWHILDVSDKVLIDKLIKELK